jgi:hypothetical protein
MRHLRHLIRAGNRLTLVSVSCALLSGLAIATPASAAGSGAQVSNVKQCETFEFGTYCFDIHTVSSFTSTPSGIESLVQNSRFDLSLIGANGACSFQQSGQDHLHAVFGPNVNESGGVTRQEYRFPTSCVGDFTIVCTTVMRFHQVNGVLQFYEDSAECTEEVPSA